MRLSPYFVVLFFAVLFCGCTPSASTEGNSGSASPAPLVNRVFAVSYPLQFLTQEIVGDEIEVLLPHGNSSDPRKSQPARETIESMQGADLVVANGTGARFAKWMALVSLPDSKIINAASHGLALREFLQIKGESIVHSVMAARTWLDPALAKKQANYIAKQLKKTYPERVDQFDENLGRLQSRLSEVVAQMDGLKKLNEQKSPVVFTAGSKFLFFARAAGVAAESIPGLAGDSDQDEGQLLGAVKDHLKNYQNPSDGTSSQEGGCPKLVILERGVQLPKTVSDLLVSFKIQAVEFELLDHPPVEGDYIEAMKRNVVRVEEALRQIGNSALGGKNKTPEGN